MSEERAQYGEAEPLAVAAERRAREMAKAAGTPALWELYLFDAYQQVSFPSGQGEKANVFTELRDLRAENERLRAELENIANANPRRWSEETRDQFQQWAQSRARAALNHAAPAAEQEGERYGDLARRYKLDAERAGVRYELRFPKKGARGG